MADKSETANSRVVQVLSIVSVPLWAAIAIVSSAILFRSGIAGAPFVTGIVVVSVIFYLIIVYVVVRQTSAGSASLMQAEIMALRQEFRSLNDKLDGLKRTLEE